MNVTAETPPGKIRVCHVITRFDKGGSAENTFLSCRDLDKKRYEVWLVHGPSLESRMGDAERQATEQNLAAAREAGVHVVCLPALQRSIAPKRDLEALWALYRLFRQILPFIVHTHTSKAGLLGRWAALLARVPVILHSPHGHVFWGYFGQAATRLFITLERFTARFTQRLVMLTEQEKKDHMKVRIAPEDKFVVIHSGVDFRRFDELPPDPGEIRTSLSLPANAFVIGAVGRLTAIKGHRYLIEAVAALAPRLDNLCCILVGDGELRPDLESLAEHLGIRRRIFFLGWRADVPAIASLFDVFVFPSLNEGMGKALVEAMALGRPVVATAVGGILNLVKDGQNGLLVPPGNAEILAKAIEFLYQDHKLRDRLGQGGRQTAQLYSSERMVRRIEELYGNLAVFGEKQI